MLYIYVRSRTSTKATSRVLADITSTGVMLYIYVRSRTRVKATSLALADIT